MSTDHAASGDVMETAVMPTMVVLPSNGLDVEDDAGSEDPGRPAVVTPHAEGNDLTYACQTDADCNFGACYVPGRGPDANPICSKRCDGDSDCPEGALCAGPLTCTDGVGCEGYGYCFRACQVDDECIAFNPTGTPLDEDSWEDNPVRCIRWASIADDADPLLAPIDICIQESEP